MTSYWLRPATAADAGALASIDRRVRRELRVDRRDRAVGVDEHGWVVEAGRGEIVGCCRIGEESGGTWQMRALYLAPEWRGLGLGRVLLETAIRAARDGGGLRIAFEPPEAGVEAAALARRLGFRRVGQRLLVLRLGAAS